MNRRALFAIVLAPALLAQGKGKGKGKGKGSTAPSLLFSESDRRLIGDWVRRQPPGGLPPGLAKRGGALPPGLEKQLRRNGRLPPGLERGGAWSPFPPDLLGVLPPIGPEYDRGFIGGRAAIVLKSARTIVDIFAPL
jgi:hypothetical protein